MIDMAQGTMLKVLVEMLHSLVELPTVAARFRSSDSLPILLHALLCVRGLVMQKTAVTHECATKLQPLLTSLHESSEPDRRRFMAACVSSMREHAEGRTSDGRSLIFLFEQLCSLVCPERPEPEYKLMLNKASTQEEFIRGSMVKNPYSSKAVGPLMRDVKNKICRDLDLGGLIEDDNGMELLVAGSIVKLDLSVRGVYEQVWARSPRRRPAYPARLDAADGGGLPAAGARRRGDRADRRQDRRGERARSSTPRPSTRSRRGGRDGRPRGDDGHPAARAPLLRVRECAALLLKLLQHCCKIRSNRKRILAAAAPRSGCCACCPSPRARARGARRRRRAPPRSPSRRSSRRSSRRRSRGGDADAAAAVPVDAAVPPRRPAAPVPPSRWRLTPPTPPPRRARGGRPLFARWSPSAGGATAKAAESGSWSRR